MARVHTPDCESQLGLSPAVACSCLKSPHLPVRLPFPGPSSDHHHESPCARGLGGGRRVVIE
eukprot:3656455-Rhodomonas_salina.5